MEILPRMWSKDAGGGKMTNGEKILNAFPNATARIIEDKDFRYIEVEQNDEWIADFNIEWWHSEYKESKTEHWIYDDIANNWRCDKCGEIPKTMGYVGTADFMSEHFRFCNHCGCRMVKPQETKQPEISSYYGLKSYVRERSDKE